jgi:hypothetical protein
MYVAGKLSKWGDQTLDRLQPIPEDELPKEQYILDLLLKDGTVLAVTEDQLAKLADEEKASVLVSNKQRLVKQLRAAKVLRNRLEANKAALENAAKKFEKESSRLTEVEGSIAELETKIAEEEPQEVEQEEPDVPEDDQGDAPEPEGEPVQEIETVEPPSTEETVDLDTRRDDTRAELEEMSYADLKRYASEYKVGTFRVKKPELIERVLNAILAESEQGDK